VIAIAITFEAATAVAALGPLRSLVVLAVAALVLGGVGEILVAVLVVEVLAAGSPLLLVAGTAFPENAVIMFRILEVIFGLDAVTGELRIARQALVLFKQLGGITALPIVLTVARLSAEVLPPLAATAATAAALSVADQMPYFPYKEACPSCLDGQAGAKRGSDPLRSKQRLAPSNGRLRSGVGRMRSAQMSWSGPGPVGMM